MIAESKVFQSGRADLINVPSLMKQLANIEKGDVLQWNFDTKTDELTIKVVKAED